MRELSKVTGHLGDRVEDLEKANESVAVRLSKLNRGGSVKSTSSSLSTNSEHDFKSRKSKPKTKTLFQNRCVQMVMLCLVAIIAISMVAMATIYIMNYFKSQENSNNSTRLIVIEEELQTSTSSTENLILTSTSTSKPSAQISQLHIIGLNHDCTEPESEDKCQTYCCALDTNEVSNELQETANFINEVPVFIVEPEILKSTDVLRTTVKTTSTVRSTSTTSRSTSVPVSSSSTAR